MKYFILWENGNLQGCEAKNKSDAMRQARAYKKAWEIFDDKPLKALTESEAIEQRKKHCLENIASMLDICKRWGTTEDCAIYERAYKALQKLLSHGHAIDNSHLLILKILNKNIK